MSDRMFGKVTLFDSKKGYGFLECRSEDRRWLRFFFHVSRIAKCYVDAPVVGALARFDVDSNFRPRRPQDAPMAINIEIFWSPEEEQQSAPATTAVKS